MAYSTWELTASRGLFSVHISGSCPPRDEPNVHHLIVAMREGLEANGYDVSATLTTQSETSL